MDLPDYTPQQVVADLLSQARWCAERGQVGNANAWTARAHVVLALIAKAAEAPS